MIPGSSWHGKDSMSALAQVGGKLVVYFSMCYIGPWADPAALLESDNIACSVVIRGFSYTDVVLFHHHS